MSPAFKTIVLGIGMIFIVVGVTNCSNKKVGGRQGRVRMGEQTIEDVLEKRTAELMSVPGVVGTAQGLCNDEPCIRVFVIKKTPEIDRDIPDMLEGFKVVVEESGEIRALPEDQ
jgi:hypothetical protein